MSTLQLDDAKRFGKRTNTLSGGYQFVLNVIFIFYSLACLLPIILIVAISFSTEADIVRDGYKFIPQHFSLEAYKFLFIDWFAIVRAYGIAIKGSRMGAYHAVSGIGLLDIGHPNLFSKFDPWPHY
jgi:putative aldouronate transport system permease protein